MEVPIADDGSVARNIFGHYESLLRVGSAASFVVVFWVANLAFPSFEFHLLFVLEYGQIYEQYCFSVLKSVFGQKFVDIELPGEDFVWGSHRGCLSNELHVVVFENVYLGGLFL